MRKLIVLVASLAITAILLSTQANDQTPSQLFQQWRTDYGLMLDLTPQEMIYRARIFEKNVQAIEEHNAKPNQNYKLGINKFTAYTKQEFESMFLSQFDTPAVVDTVEEPLPELKLNIDWVSYGAVSPVKNQGSCTASYAFASIGGIEGISYIFYKSQTEYSVQQLVDCSQSYGNSGCTSGNFVSSYNYIVAKGINTQAAYPYQGRLGQCQSSSGLFKIKSSTSVNTCTAMENALAGRPVPVAVDGQNFANYHSGIFDSCGKSVSLAVLLVGSTDQYYRLKVSWGVSWGEAGYIRLSRVNNVCGICGFGTYPNP